MTDIDQAFAVALEAALRASADLPAAMGLKQARIYREVPANAVLPYLVLGEDEIGGDADECQDGSEIDATLHGWFRADDQVKGSDRARQVGKFVRAIVTGLEIEGHDVVLAEFGRARYLTDPDGSTHAVWTCRYLTVPTV